MANILPHDRRKMVLRMLCEGCSIRSTSRIASVDKDAVCRLILQFGKECAAFLNETLRGLALDHLECDEIWSYVGKKQARLTVIEKEERHDIGDVYLFTAIDATTKLLVIIYLTHHAHLLQ